MTAGTKLSILAHTKTQTFVNNVTVDYWDQLNIFHVKPNGQVMDRNMYDDLAEVLEQRAAAYSEQEPVILIGDTFEIEVYHLGETPALPSGHPELEFE